MQTFLEANDGGVPVRGVPAPLARPASGAWLASVALVPGATALVWWRRAGSEAAIPRLFGVTALLAVSANMHVDFYDGLQLLVPGVVSWVLRDEYASRWHHWLIGVCILLVFLVGYAHIFFVPEGISWAGPLIGIWLLGEAADLLVRPRYAPAPAAR